jgi:hypothetical protein
MSVSTTKRLILTTGDSGAGALKVAGLADCVIDIGWRFVWGKLRSPVELDTWLSSRPVAHEDPDFHWLSHRTERAIEDGHLRGLGLVDFCERFETVELWIDPEPNAQLILIWLLDFLRPHTKITQKLRLVQADVCIGEHTPEALMAWWPATVAIGQAHLEAARAAWQAWRASTPQMWSDLLVRDLSVLPRLSEAVVQLLEELPHRATGLGATEMRMLEIVSEQGQARPCDLFPGEGKSNTRRVFEYWEVGALLDGLASGPVPAISRLEEGPFTLEMHNDANRHKRYKQSKLSLTALGKAVLAGTDDFSRHNPIHRWWGGTELTNDRLWRWDPANRILIAP